MPVLDEVELFDRFVAHHAGARCSKTALAAALCVAKAFREEEGLSVVKFEQGPVEIHLPYIDEPYGWDCILPGQELQGRIIGASKARYSGEAIELTTASGATLRVTRNHPVLTEMGLVPARDLREGGYLLHYVGEDKPGLGYRDVQYAPTVVEDVFETIRNLSGVVAGQVTAGRDDFHGDAALFQGNVDVVGSYCPLPGNFIPKAAKNFSQGPLVRAQFGKTNLASSSPGDERFHRVGTALSRIAHRVCLMMSGLWGKAIPNRFGRFTGRPKFDVAIPENAANYVGGDAKFPSYRFGPNPIQVAFDDELLVGGELAIGSYLDTVLFQGPSYRRIPDVKSSGKLRYTLPGKIGLSNSGNVRHRFSALGTLDSIRFGPGSQLNVPLKKARFESGCFGPQLFGQCRKGFSGKVSLGNQVKVASILQPADSCRSDVCVALLADISVSLDRIVSVRRFHYDGPIYDFESTTGYIIVNRLLISNCGADCFLSLALYFGVMPDPQGVDEAVRLLGTSPEDGTNPERIVAEGQRLGVNPEPRQNMTVEELRWNVETGRPVLVLLQAYGEELDRRQGYPKYEDGHYVVVIGVTDADVIVMDPILESARGVLPITEFESRWHDQAPDGTPYVRWGCSFWRQEQGEYVKSARKALRLPWYVSKKADPFKFSSTQVNVDDKDLLSELRRMTKRIPDADLAEDGREDLFHITIKYGIHGSDAGSARQIVEGFGPINVRLGKTSLFQSDEYGVVKIDVESDDLRRLNKLVADNLECTDTHPKYQPHLTLAYVKPGNGEKYAGWGDVDGKELEFTEIIFSDSSGNHTTIPTASYDWAGSKEKGIVGDTVQAAGRFLAARWADLEQRYGRKQALAMAVAMIASAPLPGNIAAIVAVAEGIRGLQGYFGKEIGEDVLKAFREEEHPRDEEGKFGVGSGGLKPGAKKPPIKRPTAASTFMDALPDSAFSGDHTVQIPISLLSLDPKEVQATRQDIRSGRPSKTPDRPITLLYNPVSGKLIVEDGMHRLVPLLDQGIKFVSAYLGETSEFGKGVGEDVLKGFCPTGEGGGVDPSCGDESRGPAITNSKLDKLIKDVIAEWGLKPRRMGCVSAANWFCQRVPGFKPLRLTRRTHSGEVYQHVVASNGTRTVDLAPYADKPDTSMKSFCPTGEGGGVDPSCGENRPVSSNPSAKPRRGPSSTSSALATKVEPKASYEKRTRGNKSFASYTVYIATFKQAQLKISAAPVPSSEAVAKAQKELDLARQGKIRAGGEARGGSAASRRRQRENLFKEFGGAEQGFCTCHGCGLKLHTNPPEGSAMGRLERGKVFVKCQGGGYQLPNLLPECFDCNRGRNDATVRKENPC